MKLNDLKNIAASKIEPFKILQDLFNRANLQKETIRLNQRQLFEKGINTRGTELRTYFAVAPNVYAYKTIEYKQKKGQKTDVVTLRDTGNWYNSLRLRVESDHAQIYDDGYLENTISENIDVTDILGLTEENTNELKKMIIPMVREQIKMNIKNG